MNVSSASQVTQIETQYISSNGNRKTLASTDDGSVRAVAVNNLSEFQCLICFDVHEKPLQTRCCESVICASCYLSLPSPKKCPSDRNAFTGSIKEDLKVAGRLINKQIELLVKNFNDVPSPEIDIEKSQKQNDAITQLKSESSQGSRAPQSSGNNRTTSQPRRQNEMSPFFGGMVNFTSGSVSSVSIGSGDITVNGRRVQGDNLIFHNGELVFGQNLTIMSAGQASRSNPVREHHFRADDVQNIYMHTNQGDIVLERQNSENQNRVSVRSSKEPRLTNNRLDLDCNENFWLKLPDSFSRNIQLHTNMGNIKTDTGYSIKFGGTLKSNIGNVDVKVDSLLVNAKGKTNMGRSRVSVQNQHVGWVRQDLTCKSNMGNIDIYDQG